MYLRTDSAHRGRSQRAGANWPRWCREYCVVFLVIVFAAYTAVLFQSKGEESEWNVCFARAARHMLAHEAVNRADEFHDYSYPPSMALLSVPLAGLSPANSLWGWWAVNVTAAGIWFVCSWRMVGGPKLAPLTTTWCMILGVGLLTSVRWNLTTLEHQQFDLVIGALLLGGCYLLWRGHSLGSGALIGAAAAMKCTPLLFAPYLLWRRKPGAALMLVGVAVGLNLLPDLLLPQASGNSYLADWVRFVRGELGPSAPGTWRADPLMNQSLAGFFHRIARFGLPLSAADLQAAPLAASTIPWLRLATYGTSLTLLAASFWRFGRPLQSPQIVSPREPLPIEASHLQVGWEVSVIICLMLLLSPMSSKAHYVVLLLPCLLLARQLVERPTPAIRVITVLLLICGPLTLKGLTGKLLGDLTLAWGSPTYFVLVVWYGAWRALKPPLLTWRPPVRKTIPATKAA